MAAENGHLDVVRYIADERGAALDPVHANGGLALIEAAYHGHLDVVRYLAERGAAIAYATLDAVDADGTTALMLAASGGHLDVVRYLAAERGAAVDAATADGATALIIAAGSGHLDVVRYLAGERGAALDAKTKDGSTALLAAAQGRHRDVQRYLAGLAAAHSKQKAEAQARELADEEEKKAKARARELAEEEERASIAAAELLAESAEAGGEGKAKNSRRHRKPRQIEEQPDPILESLRQSKEASARANPQVDQAEPSNESGRLASKPSPPNPDVQALHRRIEQQAADLERLNTMFVSKEEECAQCSCSCSHQLTL